MSEKVSKRKDPESVGHDQCVVEVIGDGLVNIQTVATALGMSPEAIRVDLCRHQFPLQPVRIGNRLRWRISDVRRFIAGEVD